MAEGDFVRVTRIPDTVQDTEHFKTRSALEQCVGQVFPIISFNEYGLIQIDVGEVLGKAAYMESIWIEPECVELVPSPTDN